MSKFFDMFRNRLNAIRNPRSEATSQLSNFMANYGWIFINSDKTEGDFSLYRHARRNVFVARCIDAIAEGLLLNGFSINNPDVAVNDPKTTNYLTNVFQNPGGYNSDLTYAMFHYQYITSFKLTGDAFIEVDFNASNTIEGFQFIPPELMRWYPDTEQWGYRDHPNLRYENDELIHIYKPSIDLHRLHYGESILEQLRLPIKMLFSGLSYNEKILDNEGLDPRAVLSFDKEMDDLTFQQELERLELIKDAGKKGGTLAIKGGSFQSSGRTNEDMDFLELMKFARNMIITAYGLQPAKLGIVETAHLGSGSGMSQDKMFKDTLDANAVIIEGAFNKVLGKNGFKEIFEFESLDIEDKFQRSQIESNQIKSGVRTVNEIRKEYGWPTVEWGDVPRSTGSPEPVYTPYDLKSANSYKNKLVQSGLWDKEYRP